MEHVEAAGRAPSGQEQGMTVIMSIYYVLSLFIIALLIWNFLRENEDRQMMLAYLIVLIPFVLRILRIR